MHWHIDSLASAPSTNDVARQCTLAAWANNDSAHGLVITAATQTAGRGQHGRAWQSPPGGLYVSAVVENIPPPYRDKLALIAGIAAAEALDQSQTFFSQEPAPAPTAAQLRWPNDLLLADRKVGGILVEAAALGDRWAAILGIGINVTTAPDDFPADLRHLATSLVAHDGRLRTVTGVLDALLTQLDLELTRLHDHGLAPVIHRLRQRDALHHRTLHIYSNDRLITGIAAGIADDGALRLNTPDGLVTLLTGTLLEVDGRPLRIHPGTTP